MVLATNGLRCRSATEGLVPGQSQIKPSWFVRLNPSQAQEPLNSQPEVWGAHQ